jgi:hypothetical protein
LQIEKRGYLTMGRRFTYTDNEDLVRGSTLDPIKHRAYIRAYSATIIDTRDVKYVFTLEDEKNLSKSIAISLIVRFQEWRVIHLNKLETLPTSNPLQDVEAEVWTVLGNDFDELCYGIRFKDIPQRLGRPIEFDLHIDASGELDCTHYGYDLPLEEDKED